MTNSVPRMLIDAREFVPGRFTGIGRVLKGLAYALAHSGMETEVLMATYNDDVIPSELRGSITVHKIPRSFLLSEKRLSSLTKKDFDLFISPYPKLPVFGCHCKSIHIIHDILDLTHPAYKRRIKVFFDACRLKSALKRADLTWYDSSWSLNETKRYTGLTGNNPRVRYPGIDEKFNPEKFGNENDILNKYDLEPNYILVVGNGLPHKNLGVLLKIADQVSRHLMFVGVSPDNQAYWTRKFPRSKAAWIRHVKEGDLPAIMRGAFCLAQPSTAEGYGYPPLEAMGCGIPAVVSNIPVLVETTGGNCAIADPTNPQTWLIAFQSLENRDVYQNQRQKGLKWVERLRGPKGWEKHIADIENLIILR